MAASESKAKSAAEIAAQAVSTAQVAVGAVPQHNAQIEKLQKTITEHVGIHGGIEEAHKRFGC